MNLIWFAVQNSMQKALEWGASYACFLNQFLTRAMFYYLLKTRLLSELCIASTFPSRKHSYSHRPSSSSPPPPPPPSSSSSSSSSSNPKVFLSDLKSFKAPSWLQQIAQHYIYIYIIYFGWSRAQNLGITSDQPSDLGYLGFLLTLCWSLLPKFRRLSLKSKYLPGSSGLNP